LRGRDGRADALFDAREDNIDTQLPPIIFVPGIQGRWEWMRPAIDAIGADRVVTFSLTECGPDAFFDRWIQRIDALAARTGAPTVSLVGVSFGGVVALQYAARHPERVARLVLVSTPSPTWRLDRRSAGYVRTPRLALPLFALRAVSRLAPEVLAGLPGWPQRASFAARYAWRALRSPVSPALMAAWAREWMQADLTDLCGRITAPTLLITGEPHLDRVVPVESTREYLQLIPAARHVVLPSTGHVGLLTQPQAFASIVRAFCDDCPSDAPRMTRHAHVQTGAL
jgi:pimeloyl-ACP methyl ester carboxylesterase